MAERKERKKEGRKETNSGKEKRNVSFINQKRKVKKWKQNKIESEKKRGRRRK